MKLTNWLLLAAIAAGFLGSGVWGQAAPAQKPRGKLAPRPLYRDPPFDAPTDPVLCFNAR